MLTALRSASNVFSIFSHLVNVVLVFFVIVAVSFAVFDLYEECSTHLLTIFASQFTTKKREKTVEKFKKKISYAHRIRYTLYSTISKLYVFLLKLKRHKIRSKIKENNKNQSNTSTTTSSPTITTTTTAIQKELLKIDKTNMLSMFFLLLFVYSFCFWSRCTCINQCMLSAKMFAAGSMQPHI